MGTIVNRRQVGADSDRDVITAVPGYELIDVLDESARTVLLRARRTADGVTFLIKTHKSSAADHWTARLLRREYQVGERLDSPHVARYVDLIEQQGGAATLVLDNVDGAILAGLIPPGGFSPQRWVELAVGLADGLEALHAAHLLHGDVRPGAALAEPESGRVTLVDLSLAAPAARNGRASDGVGRIEGTPAYMAPEQTGRIQSPVDQRSDLYSLGVTLFELACGRRPFPTDDLLELVHAHIARRAPSPRDLNPAVPPVMAAIITKLLAKSPDERYQSVRGLKADLERLRQALGRNAVADFTLGVDDAPEQLRLPSRLYGREPDVGRIRASFDRVSAGARELLLVAGPTGIGKTSLVSTIRSVAAERQGYFVSGKFEQLGRSTPYGPIKHALRELVRPLLSETDARLTEWRRDLSAHLGAQAGVIIDLVPELERIMGPQPPVEPLGPVEAEYRFARLFCQLMSVFAKTSHPLVLFIDDWQWADSASLKLIHALATDPAMDALLLVGAYRDTEVDDMHPAMATAQRIRKAGVPNTLVTLGPLGHVSLTEMLLDTLHCPPDHASALASAVEAQTKGNPFFVRALLQTFQDTGVLTFDRQRGWRAELRRLDAPSEKSVLELVIKRIERLPQTAREMLETAAYLGSELALADLAIAANVSEEDAVVALEPALEARLLLTQRASLRFLHDRVQEAAYSLTSPDGRARRHLEIGRRLIARADERGTEDLSRATDHLNVGRDAIGDPSERLAIAALNLRVGRLARQSTAYAAAAAYAAAGTALLPPDGWRAHYALTLDLHSLRAESEYLSGSFATAEQIYPVALAGAQTNLDRIRVLTIQKDQYELQGRYAAAIDILRDALTLVGVSLPHAEEDLSALLRQELELVPRNLAGRPIASLADMPEVTDPELIARLNLLMGMWPSCYVCGLQTLLAVVSAKIANFCLVYGNCEITPAAYVNYSFVAGYVTGDYQTAYEFGQLGIKLTDRYSNRSVRSWCYFLFGCGTALWRQALRQSNDVLERSFELGIESGNLASASYACSYIVTDRFFQGAPLAEVDELYAKYSDFLRRNNPAIHLFLELGIRGMRRLVGRDTFDDAVFLEAFASNAFFMAAYRAGRLPAAYLLSREPSEGSLARPRGTSGDAPSSVHAAGPSEDIVALADEAIASALPLLAGTWKVVEVMTFAALMYLRAWRNASAGERIRYEQAALRMLDELRRLSSSCRANLEHKVLLVEAEIARVRGLLDEAAALYQRAADAAALEGFRLYEALANELAGRFWKERGLTKVARAYLSEAHACYAAWGAKAKVDSLVHELGDLVSPVPQAAASVPGSRTGGAPKAYEAEPLDFLSVAKAWQAISSEIERDRLIDKLMRIIVESAGAQRGALLLKVDGELRVVATAENGAEHIETAADASVGASRRVTDSIVRYTARTGETVVLQDASAHGLFVGDVQVRERRLRSVLCVPIRIQDESIGVVYMENDLSAGAFTPSRAFVVELLAGQAAVSLENARLYSDLRAAMSNVEAARREAEGANRTKDEFLAMLGHELRNPLAPILTALQLMHLRGSNVFETERAIIDRQVKHMVRLVDDLLEVSRITRGKISLESVPVDLGEALAKALEMASPLFDQRQHLLTTDVESGLTARGDPARLAQVFSNLLTNAAKYTPLRGRIAIRAWRDGPEAVVSVKDTGIGIAPETLPKIFDLFVQERQSIDRSRGGLGLGLALVRSLVDMHGGRVEAQSAGPNQGSEFIVRLPAVTQAADHAGTPAPVRAPRVFPAHDLCRILVVDDNEDAADTIAQALRELGHEVRTAQDGAAALVCLESFTPEVAILDIGLPVMDGYELARHIRLQERLANTRLIALTGYGQGADKVRAHEAGFDVHLVKPVDLDVLVALLGARAPRSVGSRA